MTKYKFEFVTKQKLGLCPEVFIWSVYGSTEDGPYEFYFTLYTDKKDITYDELAMRVEKEFEIIPQSLEETQAILNAPIPF